MEIKGITPYFLGLLEGDGSIQVNHWKKKYLQFRIIIKLKYTEKNYHLCALINNQHNGFMNLHIRHGFVILVQDDQSKLRHIMKIIESYGLLKPKMKQDYEFFHYCYHTKPTISEYSLLKQNKHLVPVKLVKTNLLKLPSYSIQQMLELDWINWWIVGFIEAEGCFSIRKTGKMSFSIGQKTDYNLIDLIKNFFSMPNRIQVKPNEMFVIEGSHRIMLANIIDFIDKHPLRGEKLNSYKQFKDNFYTPKT